MLSFQSVWICLKYIRQLRWYLSQKDQRMSGKADLIVIEAL
jgi:hypothetical protein